MNILFWSSKEKTTRPLKCCDCGFLAIQDKGSRDYQTTADIPFVSEPTYAETPRQIRDSGRVGIFRGLTCFMDEPQWSNESKLLPRRKEDSAALDYSTVIQKERDCESAREYLIGFSPKEHLQMRVDDSRRAQDNRIRRNDRLLQLAIAFLFVAAGVATALLSVAAERNNWFGGKDTSSIAESSNTPD